MKGHDFSRAAEDSEMIVGLAPEGRFSQIFIGLTVCVVVTVSLPQPSGDRHHPMPLRKLPVGRYSYDRNRLVPGDPRVGSTRHNSGLRLLKQFKIPSGRVIDGA